MEEQNVEQKPIQPEVENKTEHIPTPTSELLMMHSGRLGRILSNLSLLGLVLLLAPLVSICVLAVYYLFLIIVPIITLGMIFLDPVSATWYSNLWAGGETIQNFAAFLGQIWPIIGGVALGLAVLSLLFLVLDKRNLAKGRIAYSIVVCVLIILFIILIATGGIQ